MRQFSILIALSLCFVSHTAKSTSPSSPTDTVTAVVVYNAQKEFIPKLSYSVADYSQIIDSLLLLDTIPIALVNQLNIYRALASNSIADLDTVIDSIFESDFVPKPVLNAVGIYLSAIHKALLRPSGFAAYVPQSKSPYPSAAFYRDWITSVPNPHRNNLEAFDSTLHLLLVDSEANCGFTPPIQGVITSLFGFRSGRNHNGIDIDLEVWDPVHAAFPGKVRVAKYYKGYGRVVVIRHFNGLETIYAHLHRFRVNPGDEVEAGDVVGLGGSSGHSTGSHLHFEIRFQGVPIPPADIIDFETDKLIAPTIALRKVGNHLAVAPNPQTNHKKVYQVKQGDYLYKIAQKFGTTVDEICKLNDIRSKSYLYKGQLLIVGT